MLKQALGCIRIVWVSSKLFATIKILQSIVIAVLTPLSISITGRLIDCIEQFVNGTATFNRVGGLVLSLSMIMLLISGNGFFDSIIMIALKRDINKNLTSVIINKFRETDYYCYEDKETADILKQMGQAPQDKILDLYITIINTISILLTIFGTIVIFIQVSIWFALFYIIILFPTIYVNYKTMDMMNTVLTTQSQRERHLDYIGSLLKNKESLYELKLFRAIDYILSKWKKINKEVLDERVRTTVQSQKYYALSLSLNLLWIAFVVFSLIRMFFINTISFGLLVSLIESLGTIMGLNEKLSDNISVSAKKMLVVKHYYTFLGLPEIDKNETIHSIDKPHIVFDNVHFTYPDTNQEILKGISFQIYPNQKIALVGANGAGKSTIIKLLCKLYYPTRGKITINGVDIKDIPMKQLRELYSVVFQDYANYQMTVRENVALGNLEKMNDDANIYKAMNDGLALNILEGMPKGLDTNLGKIEEDGIDLSTGQWQRIAISRACLSNSAFVILDEPTAAMDPIAESEMYAAFSEVIKDRGCIMISHRLASAKLADNIVVLHDGIVAEQGSHDELMTKKGFYCSMFEMQSSWYDEGGK